MRLGARRLAALLVLAASAAGAQAEAPPIGPGGAMLGRRRVAAVADRRVRTLA